MGARYASVIRVHESLTNASWSASAGTASGNFSARFTAPVTSMACGAPQSTGMYVGWLVAGSMPRHVPADHTFDWSTFAILPRKASCWLFGPGSCRPHSILRSPDWRQALSPDHSRLTLNLPFGSYLAPRYWRADAWHCSELICWMRAGDGGAASGPYSLPGNVRMSMASETSKRCSSLQSTTCAASGVRSGQFRQSPLLEWSNVSLPRAPIEVPPIRPIGLLPSSPAGSAVMRPAMRRPPRAVSSRPRRVEAACRLCHQG